MTIWARTPFSNTPQHAPSFLNLQGVFMLIMSVIIFSLLSSIKPQDEHRTKEVGVPLAGRIVYLTVMMTVWMVVDVWGVIKKWTQMVKWRRLMAWILFIKLSPPLPR